MVKIFFASHGKLASGLKSSLEILLGESENLTVFDAYLDEKSIQEVLEDYLTTLAKEDDLVLCSDLFGGSVNQVMYLYLKRPNTYLVAGVNLAFMLGLSLKETINKQDLTKLIESSRKAICLVEDEIEILENNDFL